MAIIREYHTIRECAQLMANEMFENVDGSLITENPDWWEVWTFKCASQGEDYDETPVGDGSGLVYAELPMWNTWFEPADSFTYRQLSGMYEELAELGFTIIEHDGEFWGLGIDGAGFDFYEAFWIPLYKALGFKWHDED
jgi:hypothetical protein